MRQRGIHNLVVALFLCAIISRARASTAAVSRPTSEPAGESTSTTDQCLSSRQEDQILCAATRTKEASVKQVIDEDETGKIEPQPPSASDKDVWTAAYDQWIAGKKTKGKPKAVNRAIEEALKRHPGAKAPEGVSSDVDLPDLDEDELTIITAAVRNISSDSKSPEDLIPSLEIIEDLCYSGDNGRQMAASGGVPHLLRLAMFKATSLKSIQALATCAQNNPTVFDTAVDAGAIGVLLRTMDGNDAIRAASLRALIAIGDSENAVRKMLEERERVVRAVLDSVAPTGTERRRRVVRALALVESCLNRDSEWKQYFLKAGIVGMAEREMKNGDIDVREGAARVLQLLR